MTSPDQEEIDRFRKKVWAFYREKGRHDLPWRSTTNPYRILVSEVMLQQTQVSRCLVKYPEFIGAYPDFSSLAGAPLADLLRVWQGMGYNRRAIALKKTAEMIMTCYNGDLPGEDAELRSLPGIGKATAASIAAFAFNLPVVFIETNIRRVFIHCFFPGELCVPDREILPLVSATLDHEKPREWYYALMDLGAALGKKIRNPNRRSAHYHVQTRFEGSRRQVRGKILALLTASVTLTFGDIARMTGEDPEIVHSLILALQKEGFLVTEGHSVRIR
ncbi:MAG TPA: A/G-specific adenine glycosylase [Methanoregulaceae archaeon]|nr:A/G-specific adenine glycosylase [Methanoregulaceae archaeon]